MRATAEYQAHMDFGEVDKYPWTTVFLREQLQALGANGAVTFSEVKGLIHCYRQEPNFRFFHGLDHAAFVGNRYLPETIRERLSDRMSEDQARAVLAIAGLFHDIAYKHVDAIDDQGTRAWPPELHDQIGELAYFERTVEDSKIIFRTKLTEAGKNDPITKMVASLFNMPSEGIIHKEGGNEFDSALAAAKFLEGKGVPPRMIVAVAAVIAATVHFLPAMSVDEEGKLGDGYMGKLSKRVATVLEDTGASPKEYVWQDTNDIMYLSVYLANRDVSDFLIPDNFGQLLRGGRRVKTEELSELRKRAVTIRELARAAGITSSAPLLYVGLGGKETPVPPENIAYMYIPRDENGVMQDARYAYPPLPVLAEAAAHVAENTKPASRYFIWHELGIVTVNAIMTGLGEPDAAVPGCVDSRLWHQKAGYMKQGLTAEEIALYKEMLYGGQQEVVTSATSRLTPIAAVIFGALGEARAMQLSQYVQLIHAKALEQGIEDPFCDPIIASNTLDLIRSQIGEHAFKVITTELRRVALHYQDDPVRGNLARANALAELAGGWIEYN